MPPLRRRGSRVDVVARVKIGAALPDRAAIDIEVARLRDFDISSLRRNWQATFGKFAPDHLPRHLLFRTLAYQIQADRLGTLDKECQQLLDKAATPEAAAQKAVDARRRVSELKPGTILTREWNGSMQRVAVLVEGFAWNGKTYPSLSGVASAITGTRWNGPRFFGLRDKISEDKSRKNVRR